MTKWAGPDKNKCFRLRLAPSKVTPSGKERVGNKWFGCLAFFSHRIYNLVRAGKDFSKLKAKGCSPGSKTSTISV